MRQVHSIPIEEAERRGLVPAGRYGDDMWDRLVYYALVPIEELAHIEVWTDPQHVEYMRSIWDRIKDEPIRVLVGDQGRYVLRTANTRLRIHRNIGSELLPVLIYPWRRTRATTQKAIKMKLHG